jgi:hypothetical protein
MRPQAKLNFVCRETYSPSFSYWERRTWSSAGFRGLSGGVGVSLFSFCSFFSSFLLFSPVGRIGRRRGSGQGKEGQEGKERAYDSASAASS